VLPGWDQPHRVCSRLLAVIMSVGTPARERMQNVATVCMVVCALVATGVIVRREVLRPSSERVEARVETIDEWEQYAVGHSIGSLHAPVTIVEFGDFQCPFCRRFKTYYDSLSAIGLQTTLIYRHLPLSGHKFAIDAVRATECASEQGRFAQMHDVLFAHQDSIGLAAWASFASVAGVPDSLRFQACMDTQAQLDVVSLDSVAARQLNIRGTPTFLINNKLVHGLPSFDSLEAWVRRAGTSERGGEW
jgi:protein-disulfide isomerase